MIKLVFISVVLFLLIIGCSKRSEFPQQSELELKMNQVAEGYVKLVLEVGLYDPLYVDAYYGPEEWKPDDSFVKTADSTVTESLNTKADDLLNKLDKLSDHQATGIETLRYRFLYKQLLSVKGIIAIISGTRFNFDDEAKILYDAVPPHFTNDHFQKILDKLEELLPGSGELSQRLNEFRNRFIIPEEKLDTVISAAITGCRKRTSKYIKLPEGENFEVEYVRDKPWGAYNWYKGNSFSNIQINLDLPVYIDRAIDLAAHEGYPGHHLFNSLLENKLTKERGWIEFSVYPLNSPASLIAEGTANYGVDLTFPGQSRIKFEKEVLFPLAGLDPDNADLYYDILSLMEKLNYSQNEAARNYLDENWDYETTINYLMKFSMHSRERAEKKIDFIETYRSYVINYNLGKDMVKEYIESNGGTDEFPDRRWQLFEELISTPRVASSLQ